MLVAAKEIDISKVDKKFMLLTPAERMVEEYNNIIDDEKEEKMWGVKTFFIEFYYELLNNYKKYGIAINYREKVCSKNNKVPIIFLNKTRIHHDIFHPPNNYRYFTFLENSNEIEIDDDIQRFINLNKIEKEVTYTEKEVEFLMNLYMDYTTDRRVNGDNIKIKEFYDFPIQTQIKEMVELENEYYNIRPKKYIKRSLSDRSKLELSYC